MTFSSEADGSAPGCENTRMPSRYACSVGMERIVGTTGMPRSASVSTLPNTMSECWSDAFSKTGANIRHGGHQSAQ